MPPKRKRNPDLSVELSHHFSDPSTPPPEAASTSPGSASPFDELADPSFPDGAHGACDGRTHAPFDDSSSPKRARYGLVYTPTLSLESESDFQDVLSDAGSASEPTTDTESPMVSSGKERDRLAVGGILLDRKEKIPKPVQDLIETLKDKERSVTPRAQYAVDKEAEARQVGEEDETFVLRNALSLSRYTEGDGHGWTDNQTNIYLDRSFIHTDLSEAQPDICNGYRKRREAASHISVPFSKAEETFITNAEVLNPLSKDQCPIALTSSMHFPFYTVQCKPGKTMPEAEDQTARDGAAINENLRALYFTAQGPDNTAEPDVLKTLHFSACFDSGLLQTWVHWFNPVENEYNMEYVDCYRIKKRQDMEEYRRFLRNWEAHAMSIRLQDIKAAIQVIMARQALANRPADALTRRLSARKLGRASKKQPSSPTRKSTRRTGGA